jgi:ligand-binding sensor domain-containing protein/signal transduction histidine kinase
MHGTLRLLLLFLALNWTPVWAALDLGDVHFESVGDADSIPDNNVTALAQDHQGFLWIGTPNGLIRYDGYRFRRYARDARDPGSLGGVFIRALLVARDGRLWVATDADGVSVHDPASGRFTRLAHHPEHSDSLSHNQVRALAEGADGSIWAGTRAGLNRVDPATGNVVRQSQRFGQNTVETDERIFALLVDRAGDLWIGSWNGIARRSGADGSYTRIRDPRLAGQLIMSLHELADGRIGVGTAQVGSYLVAPTDESVLAIPVDLERTPSATEALALAMIQPRADELWLGAFGGITVVDVVSGRVRRQILPDSSVSTSLSHTQVRAFLKDRAGMIWIGGYSGGLQQHDPANDAVRVLHHRPSQPGTLANPSISSILELDSGEIWLGTREQGIDVLDPQRGVISRLRPDQEHAGGLGNGMVLSLAQARDGSVFAGTLAGMFRYLPDSGNFEAIGAGSGLVGSTVRCLLADPGGDLWIGSNAGLSRWLAASGKVATIPVSAGGALAADVNALALEAGGRLWVGSTVGLHVLEPGAESMVAANPQDPRTNELTGGSVVGLLIDRAGQLWIDTANGLSRLRSWDGRHAQWDAVSMHLGIGGQPFGANLLDDAEGRIWSQKYIYDPTSNRVHELSRADGIDIGTAWYRSYARLRSGQLMFGGSRGVAVIDPTRFRTWDYQPPVVVSELRVDSVAQEPAGWQQGLTLDAAARSFNVEFAALDYSAPARNRYAHRLVGYDDDWIETDATRRIASYSKLWPGDYRLEIRGSNRVGTMASQPLTLAVRVLPAYWQTPAFALLALFGLGAAIYAGYRWNLVKVRRHEHELELMVEQRTHELSEAKVGAETALVRLQDAQQQLVAAEKMASLGQLVAGVAHEINTPLGIAVTAASVQSEQLRSLRQRVQAHALKISDLDQYLVTAGQAGQLVDDHLARAAHLVRSFKQVSVDRSTDERRSFDLKDFLDELVENLEIAWKRRPIRFQLSCPPDLILDNYPGTLGQIITTFAQNALQHAYQDQRDGLLCISARAMPNAQIELIFADDGGGIDSSDLPRVFEPFFTTRRADGFIGLGLHTVYNLVNGRLHGQIEVDSELGKGTRFTLRFPQVAPA